MITMKFFTQIEKITIFRSLKNHDTLKQNFINYTTGYNGPTKDRSATYNREWSTYKLLLGKISVRQAGARVHCSRDSTR